MVTTDPELVDKVEAEIYAQRNTLKRQATIDKVIANGIFLITAPDMDTAAEIAGDYAPEHLEIHTAEPEYAAKRITAAGAIFLGQWTPEPIGDFCAGPSHVLPTAGSAKRFNGLETVSFFRRTSLIKYSEAALKREAEIAHRFGCMEQLDGHGRSATIRCEK